MENNLTPEMLRKMSEDVGNYAYERQISSILYHLADAMEITSEMFKAEITKEQQK